MKILLAYRSGPHGPHLFGGIQTFMAGLARAVRARGHTCEIFLFGEGIESVEISAGCLARVGGLADLIQLIVANRPDVVHASTSDWDAGIAVVRKIANRPKLILTHHSELYPVWSSLNCDALVGCASWAAREQQDWTDLPVQVVLNGIDTCRFTPPHQRSSDQPIVAWVGRGSCTWQKRIDKLARVGPLLVRQGIRLWIADPCDRATVPTDVVRALEPIAEFWGKVPIDNMPNFFRKVAASGGCVLSTSEREGLPMVLIEAQACGCPVVAPDLKGMNECVRPLYGGVLYPFEASPSDVATLVTNTVHDVARWQWRKEASRRLVIEQFNIERMADEYLRIYDEAPYTRRNDWAGIRARLRVPPKLSIRCYILNRWPAASTQYTAFLELMHRKEQQLARTVARTSFSTCPTIYLRRTRYTNLIKTLLQIPLENTR